MLGSSHKMPRLVFPQNSSLTRKELSIFLPTIGKTNGCSANKSVQKGLQVDVSNSVINVMLCTKFKDNEG